VSQAPAWLTARPIAHRGLHNRADGIVENSPTAAKAAVAGKFAIECDVQLTRDGEVVVFHDFTLDRLTSAKGDIGAETAAHLAGISLKDAKAADTIISLGSFIDLIAGKVPLVIEIKSRFDGDLRLTRRVAEIIAGRPEPLSLKSFDPRIVAALRMISPDRPRGIVAMAQYEYPDYARISAEEKHARANLLHFDEMQPDFISWNVKDLPHCGPHLCRVGLGLPVMTWTVRTADDRARAARYADQIVFEGFVPE
jgi:glycerophosphoryl diester phosphodiesterase